VVKLNTAIMVHIVDIVLIFYIDMVVNTVLFANRGGVNDVRRELGLSLRNYKRHS